ncbi:MULTISPECIES: response regulator [Flavobacterium]|uniref:response regulator n=1 Tax=Flavobacterium TaxID=237 RepID=UPI00086F7A13|nr:MULTISPECIES: response regulator [Flavobacterium]MBN9285761.1 response regulator [Flavobacterium sp.]ODS84837.1 MAG: hypothetical protein ABS44_16245 [Chryseobacterium sp. SCN 40-13]OJV70358.1 MAG: hypothetical protein BGO42_10755 [Flavobacterium sp. 40-81]
MNAPKSICIIDDDPIYQLITKKIIEKSQLFSQILSYKNGKVAIDSFKEIENAEEFPDVILLDIDMPEMDAWAFMNELRRIDFKFEKKPAIYIASSSIANEDREKANSFPEIIGYLCKPIDRDILERIDLENPKN